MVVRRFRVGIQIHLEHNMWRIRPMPPSPQVVQTPIHLGIAYQTNSPYHEKEYSAFGEVNYQITDTLKATVGARWYKYDTSLNYEQSGIFSQSGNASQFTGSVATNADRSESEVQSSV